MEKVSYPSNQKRGYHTPEIVFGIALVSLSMDNLQKTASQQMSTPPKHSSKAVELPASYGRALPISEDEIAAINVSPPL